MGIVLLVLVGTTFLMSAQAQRGETEAERFVVKDKDNKSRAVLGMSKGKANPPWLLLTDETGKGRTMLFPGRLDLADENGKRQRQKEFRARDIRPATEPSRWARRVHIHRLSGVSCHANHTTSRDLCGSASGALGCSAPQRRHPALLGLVYHRPPFQRGRARGSRPCG
jgi:hypothetical protein